MRSFNLLKTLSGIETQILTKKWEPTRASTYSKPFQGLKHRRHDLWRGRHWLQPTQNPFRDWNRVARYSNLCRRNHRLQPTQNPFRDWNISPFRNHLKLFSASTYSKPFQGLKRVTLEIESIYSTCFNLLKTLSGIETASLLIASITL